MFRAPNKNTSQLTSVLRNDDVFDVAKVGFDPRRAEGGKDCPLTRSGLDKFLERVFEQNQFLVGRI